MIPYIPYGELLHRKMGNRSDLPAQWRGYLLPLQAIFSRGGSKLIYTIDEFFSCLRERKKNGDSIDFDWIIRTDDGSPVSKADIDAIVSWRWGVIEALHRKKMSEKLMPRGRRNGVVPHTRYRGGYGNYFRKPRTFQEIRANAALQDDFDDFGIPEKMVKMRKNIVTSWDDVPRHTERSWKKTRRHQWRRV